MKKNKKRVIVCFILFLMILIVYEGGNKKSYALSTENPIDELMVNKIKQKELNVKIGQLENEIKYKNELASNNSNVEVISLSFVENEVNVSENTAISNLEQSKSKLSKELERYVIKGVQLQKSIESEKQQFMKENNLTYISGIWPLNDYKEVSSPFGYRIHPISKERSFHKGIDIPAPQSTDILSSDDGIVLFSDVQNGYGNVVKIKHFDGKVTVYAHNTENIVKEGDIVKKGQVISKVGSTGDSTGNHVHFETIVNDENINPIDVIWK